MEAAPNENWEWRVLCRIYGQKTKQSERPAFLTLLSFLSLSLSLFKQWNEAHAQGGNENRQHNKMKVQLTGTPKHNNWQHRHSPNKDITYRLGLLARKREDLEEVMGYSAHSRDFEVIYVPLTGVLVENVSPFVKPWSLQSFHIRVVHVYNVIIAINSEAT